MVQVVQVNLKRNAFIILILLAIGLAQIYSSAQAHLPEENNSSFALEYKELRILLQKVVSAQTAATYKPAIKQQIDRLKQNQAAGEQTFSSMSESQQQLFVKKFQNNRFHCGEVTQVMQERQRILLHPDLSIILRELLNQIP